MQAVYELLTVAPYMPTRAKFTRAELDVYVKGYQRALAQALKVMKPAAKRWEARIMRDYRPHQIDPVDATASPDAARQALIDDRVDLFICGAMVFVLVMGLELLVLVAVLIRHFLR